jgi:hypothetical protein
MDTATHENPEIDPQKVVGYWTRCLRESMLRDPKLTNHQQVKIEHVLGGWLPLDVVSALKTGKSEKSRSDPKSRSHPSGQDGPISVLVAPYMVASVRDRSRAIEEELLALFWVPGQLMPDGSLQSDLAHLPFLSRALLDPPIGDRKETPPAVASWNEYDSAIRAMGVDWAERWNDRIKHAEEMFRLVAGVGATEWEADGWQRAKHSIVLPWNKESGPAKFILPLCDAWLKEETLPGTLQTIASSAGRQPCVDAAVKADTMHLGHYGENALNRKQRDAIHAVRRLKEGQAQTIRLLKMPPAASPSRMLTDCRWNGNAGFPD